MVAPVLEQTDLLPNNLTAAETAQLDPALARLSAAALSADTQAFLTAYRQVDWSQRPPEDFIRATRMALAAGAHLTAREISALGAEAHPDHAELQKYARLLAPPRIIPSDVPLTSSMLADRDWLKHHRLAYKGQWVALRDGKLLVSAATLQELTAQLGSSLGTLFTKVY